VQSPRYRAQQCYSSSSFVRQVGPLTTSAKTQCLCTHLTSFGGGFAVPPNTIDFATVFTAAKFLESIPVFSTVITFIAVWVIVCIWARHMDKKDIARVSRVCYLQQVGRVAMVTHNKVRASVAVIVDV